MTLRLAAALVLLVPALAAAHPLGNFTTNRHATLAVGRAELRVEYVIDLAELPTFRTLAEIDADHDGTPSDGERDAWATRLAAEVAGNLHARLDGAWLDLRPLTSRTEVAPGAGGLATLRVELSIAAPLETARGSVVFVDDNFAGLPGWHAVIATAGDGVALADSSVPSLDRTAGLRRYPDDQLTAPPQVRDARFTFAPGVGGAEATPPTPAARTGAARFGDHLTALVADHRPLTAGVVASALFLAALLGAFHALTPGHGKTIVGAYLVGARGTWRHAVFLGLVVTATHTLGVYALGLGTLVASAWILPERLLAWLSAVSGLLVVAVGASLLRQRLEVALHGHAHLPPAGTPVNLSSLLALGISGGLLPCPSALVVMLGAIALGRTAFGLALILAFSTGLAAVLTTIGLVLVYARGLFDRMAVDSRFARYAPVASAVVISFAGLAIVVEALVQLGT